MNVFPTAVNELGLGTAILQSPGGPLRTQAGIFEEIFLVFLSLGTFVGIIVIAYTIYNAYKYRYEGGKTKDEDFEAPVVGELPTESGGGKKLFVSFGISAIIVISLVIYAYGLLLAVENPTAWPEIDGDTLSGEMEVDVEGFQFGWRFTYPNGYAESGTLRVPDDHIIWLTITSTDVWHNFGVTELRIKSDAIPGDTSRTWFIAPETAPDDQITYRADCFELCGIGHSQMTAEIIVMNEEQFDNWYANTTETQDS